MSPAEIVAAFIGAIERKDVDAAIALTAPNISYENMPIDPVVGQAGVSQMLGAFLAPATEVDWQVLSQYEHGKVVVNERLDRFKIGSGWLELPVAGFFHIDGDDKISIWRDYFDMGSYERQITELTAS